MFRYKRSERVQELLLEELSKMVQHELKDPRIGFVTLTRIALSDNLKHAKVFVSILGTDQVREEGLKGLNSAKGFLRSQLGKRLYLKAIPELDFKLDTSGDQVDRITQLLRQIHKDDDE
ncbi:30S ribosome-binding factor RbfA [Nitrospina gracilis]|uniref:30S ribosome-binding factor RbfA n=1 Tax=Nitrospina gracilis TaxID=35801 RepID=UPI001F014BC7|nr:30S ribosome-binding factor RbfA [Nitrospina gracilis]MCF8720236.1 ribosome-binding factor A [Nitrospina gracilis Nb-211]